MSDEHDSWFKSAFGVDLGESVNKITTALDQAKKTATHVVESVQEAAIGKVGAATGTFPLGASVGRGGKNAPNDVRAVQAALGIAADGQCGPQTIAAIKTFQKNLGHAKPDGRVDPGGGTERALAGGTKPLVTSNRGDAQEDPTELDSKSSSIPAGSTDHEDKEDLVGALLGHQAALLKSLQNAGSEAEREQIEEELEGVSSEISSELQTLKAKEAIREAETPEASFGAEARGQASDTGSDAADGAGALAARAWQGVTDHAAAKYGQMKQDAKLVADGEHWLAGQIDDLQDTAAAKVQGVADLADGIPVVEQVADLHAAAFDQATQLSAGAMEGAVGMGGALLQVAANPVDAAKGLYTMAEHVPMPIAGPNPLKAAHGIADVVAGEASLADTTAKLFDPVAQQNDDAAFWKTVGGGLADQYEKTVGADGDYAKGVGRAIFDIGSNLIGLGEAGASAKAAEAAKLAEAGKLAEVPRAAEAAKLAEAGKLAEAPALTEAAKLLETMLDDSAKLVETQKLLETMLDDSAKAAKAPKVSEAAKLAEAPALTEAAELVKTVLDDAAKAVEASEVVQGVKTAVAKARAPKAGSITAENINRVTGMQAVLKEMDRLNLTLNRLGLTPDEVIRMANADPAAAVAKLNEKLEIAKTHAAEVEAHAIAKQQKLDAWHAEAEAERRWYREDTVGRTPPKDSSVGREVMDRMRQQGKIRGNPPHEEVFHQPTQEWYPLAECDMGHTTDAVRWWNKEGKYYGEKSDMVRDWMNDAKNYELEPSRINRSRGGQVDEHYLSPHDDPITPDELAGRVKDRTPEPDE